VENDYTYWTQALADPKALHAREFQITEDPEPGFYRTKDLKPVAIWYEEEVCVIMIGHDEAFDHKASDIWLQVAKHPVTEAAYRTVLDGGQWPDVDTFLAGIGANRFRGDDPVGLIDDLAMQAETYKLIDSEEVAQRAMSLRNALLEKGKEVDARRDELKRPHLDKCREIDTAWMPPVKKADKWAKYLRTLVETYRTRVLRQQREAEERLRSEVEARDLAGRQWPPPLPDQIRSGHGRAASVRTKIVVTGFSNFAAAALALQDEPELLELMQKLAQKKLDGDGEMIPGIITEERAVVR